MIVSFLYFLLVPYLLGHVVDLFIKKWDADIIEKIFIRYGVGLALFSVLGVIFDLLFIPLHWVMFLLAGIILAVFAYRRTPENFRFSGLSNKTFLFYVLVFVLFGVTIFMYVSGSFSYSWFEDGDPWTYAAVSDYIAGEQTFKAPYHYAHYVEPYTQGYQIVMAMLIQLNDSAYWTLKFFTSFWLAFGIVFFYLFARRFSGSEDVGLVAALFLFSMPAWLSHFTFSLNYNMVFFVLLLAVFAMMFRDSRWWPIVSIVIASMLVNHFYTAFVALIFFSLGVLVRFLMQGKLDMLMLRSMLVGVLASLLFYIPAFARHWDFASTAQKGIGGAEQISTLGLPVLIALFVLLGIATALTFWSHKKLAFVVRYARAIYLGGLALVMVVLFLPFEIVRQLGSASRAYTISDFFSASSQNLINNPIGYGPVAMVFFLLGLVLLVLHFKKLFKNEWLLLLFTWSLAGLLLVNAVHFSIAISPFRIWTFLALFVALVAAFGLEKLFTKQQLMVKAGIFAVVAVIVVFTAFMPKYELNTMQWPDHTIAIPPSLELYDWMRHNVEWDSNVLSVCKGLHHVMPAYGMNYEYLFDPDIYPWRESGYELLDHSIDENYDFYKSKNVEYLIGGAACVKQDQEYGVQLQERINAMAQDPRFSVVHSTDSEVLFRIE